MAKKRLKTEKLWIHCERGGELTGTSEYTARDAARKATKLSRDGWSCKVTSNSKRATTFMTCEPSAKRKYWSDPRPKAHAICKMTPAFKKRIQAR